MKRSGQDGFSLVEMLVVLAIIGIAAGATTLAVGVGGNRGGEVEARRLAARLELAVDEAMVTDRLIAFAPRADGYSFSTWDTAARRWRPDPVAALGRSYDLPSGLRLDTDLRGELLLIDGDGGGRAMRARIGDVATGSWKIEFDGSGANAAAEAR